MNNGNFGLAIAEMPERTKQESLPQKRGDKKFILLVSFVAALGGLLFGFHAAIISGIIPYTSAYFAMNEYMLGWSVSSILVG